MSTNPDQCDWGNCMGLPVALYRLDCSHCNQHRIKQYCKEHEDVVKERIAHHKTVTCTTCSAAKRSQDTYKRLGAA